MSIHDIAEKIKGRAGEQRHLFISMGILIAASAFSFYLGYTARAESHKESLVSIICPENAYMDAGNPSTASINTYLPAAAGAAPGLNSGAFTASKNGKKYYPAGCAGASRIKNENKVYFATSAQAVAAGYSLAAGCSAS